MIPENLKHHYYNKNIQFISTDFDGHVLASDQTLFPITIGASIAHLHPFFESLPSMKEALEKEMVFNSVHLTFNENDLIADIKFLKEEEGILVLVYDLTQHYTSYQLVAQARNESLIKEELVVLKNKELEERERFKNAFIQNFSHELRNPLTSIISITNILEKTKLSQQQKEMIAFLKESNTNLQLLLEDTLSISMIASGKLELQNKSFSLFQLLELLQFAYRAKAEEKGLEFHFEKAKQVPDMVEGDRLRLFQVLTNLLDNAIKYTTVGSVGLKVQFNQKYANKVNLRFEVSDTGPGIPEESAAVIFESFSRLHSGDRHFGVGLGLAIVKGLLTLMESKISMHSTPGEGSIFYFDLGLKLPLKTLTKSIIKGGTGKTKPETAYKPKRKYKLLLVEDDERVLTVLFKSLTDTQYFYIDVVNDGALVMEHVINTEYDLILMDVNLPNTRGDQLTKLIREFPFKNIKKIPVVGITANAFEADRKEYLDAGMNVVLVKPFEIDTLLKTIFKYLK